VIWPRRVDCRHGIGGWGRVAAAACVLMLLCGGCARGRVGLAAPPDWANSSITTRDTVRVTPSMSMTERLEALRQAKETIYQQLREAVYALPLTPEMTIDASLGARPGLRPGVDAYVRRGAVIESHWRDQQLEIQATLEVGDELLNLLKVKQRTAPSTDRTAPSTGIVRPY
jgi:hypothetical protein